MRKRAGYRSVVTATKTALLVLAIDGDGGAAVRDGGVYRGSWTEKRRASARGDEGVSRELVGKKDGGVPWLQPRP
jgi:hypothetical protein